MIAYLPRAMAAQIRRGKLLYALSTLGVALGVASVLSIQILAENALAAFRGTARAVSGDSDLTVVGSLPWIPDSLLLSVLATPGVEAAWPLLRVPVAVEGDEPLFLEVVGVDMLAPAARPLPGLEDRAARSDPGRNRDRSAEVLAVPGWSAITPELSEAQGWGPGDSIRVSHGARVATLRVGARVDFRSVSPFASDKLVVMDISQAQHAFGEPGQLSDIEVRLTRAADRDSMAAALAARLGPGAQVLTPQTRERDMASLLGAFRLNLTALSLISLVVGVFLVHQSIQAALTRRRGEFGLLRSLGATRGQVVGLVLLEAGGLGLTGTAAGLVLGWIAAGVALSPVSSTLTNVYLASAIETLHVGPGLIILAILVGVGGALAGGLLPALELGRRDVRTLLLPVTLHERTGRLAGPLAWGGVALLVAGGLWYVAGGRSLQAGGFGLAAVLLVGLPLLTPAAVRLATRGWPIRGFGWSYGVRGLGLRLQTTSTAVGALGVAITMLVAVTLLVGSFRRTLQTWVDATLTADIYVTTESWARGGAEAAMTPEIVSGLASAAGVEAIETLRQIRIRLGSREVAVDGVDFAPGQSGLRIPLAAGDPVRALARLREGGAVVSEPLARRLDLSPGDPIDLPTPEGPATLTVAAVSYDYSSETGKILVSQETLARLFGDGPAQNVALFLGSDADVSGTVSALRARFAGRPLVIRSQSTLRDDVLHLFDQTFAITRLLQVMALLVAAAGISLALLVVVRERRFELGLYRALGSLRGQIFRLMLSEALAMGVLGLFLGCLGGTALAWILVEVINPAYFGWSIRFAWPWGELVQEAVSILTAALIAGVVPALRAGRVPARDLARDAL